MRLLAFRKRLLILTTKGEFLLNRCDFSSISTCLKNHISESNQMSQAKISPKISAYYSKPSNQEKLAHTIHQNLLPLMSDCNMAIQDIYTLFIQDDSISDAKKKNLTPLYKPASSRLLFLAKLISLLPWHWQQNFWKMECQLQTSY